MKSIIYLTLFGLGALTFSAHSQAPTMDVSRNSKVEWTGQPLVGKKHQGTISIASGYITLSDFEQDKFDKGKIVLDMNTIQNTDMPENDGGADLVNHLKSDDFFAVAQFPHATFEITNMVPLFPLMHIKKYSVTGNLTIKGITHEITFPIVVTDSDKGIQMEGAFIIDRTKWNINYKSKSVMSTVKDGIISDEISIAFKLQFAGC